MPKLYLKRGKEKPLRNHHPWIFSGAVARVENANDGDTVEVYDAAGEWLARAAYNARSQIAARVWTFERDEPVDRAFFERRLARAMEYRKSILQNDCAENALRLVNAESDFLPGVVVDCYADFLVVQFLTLGAELHKDEIVGAIHKSPLHPPRVEAIHKSPLHPPRVEAIHKSPLHPPRVEAIHKSPLHPPRVGAIHKSPLHPPRVEAIHESPQQPRGIYERSDVDVRKKEGLKAATGVLWGDAPPDKIEIVENDLHFWVDVKRGHKTGFYLDQRLNRQRAAPYLRGNVLNAFAYTGAFGVYAAKFNDARVTNLDASASALELARENFALNVPNERRFVPPEYIVADAFEQLRAYRATGRKFDAIVLDPPKFVTAASNLERATRGYKDLNMLAFQLLNPRGFLVTFSCSGLVDAKLFQQIVFAAAVDAQRDAQIVERLGQAPDHPIGLHFPEGEYLKGLVVRAT